MSVITDIMLCASDSEIDAIEHINTRMPDLSRGVKTAPWKFRSYVALIIWFEFSDSPQVITLTSLPR